MKLNKQQRKIIYQKAYLSLQNDFSSVYSPFLCHLLEKNSEKQINDASSELDEFALFKPDFAIANPESVAWFIEDNGFTGNYGDRATRLAQLTILELCILMCDDNYNEG